MLLKTVALFTAITLNGQALAVNKCTDTDGKVSFQDAPCIGKGQALQVKPASGKATTPTSSNATSTLADRINADVAESQRNRRIRELEGIHIRGANAELAEHRAACAQQQKELAAKQYAYVQNLYGKTHAAQIASEMAAVSSRCDQKDRELVQQEDLLKAECVKLGGKKCQ
jgi:hypothetical protein